MAFLYREAGNSILFHRPRTNARTSTRAVLRRASPRIVTGWSRARAISRTCTRSGLSRARRPRPSLHRHRLREWHPCPPDALRVRKLVGRRRVGFPRVAWACSVREAKVRRSCGDNRRTPPLATAREGWSLLEAGMRFGRRPARRGARCSQMNPDAGGPGRPRRNTERLPMSDSSVRVRHLCLA